MNSIKLILFVILAMLMIACGAEQAAEEDTHTHADGSTHEDHGDDPEAETGDSEEGEEDGTQFSKDQKYDVVRRGMRLILAYDAEKDAFVGTVENVTEETIAAVRVEVHLSNSVELGPTPLADLASGEIREVELSAEGNEFETWSAHPESGEDEHSEEDEGTHSHEGEEGEHTHQ